jgi:catechol 2,3-dioxygenase-like lactoylglutathione lyase family enzyme
MLGDLVANLKVPDLDDAIAFYEGKLGLPVADRRRLMPGHEDVVIQAGDATICLEVGAGGGSDTPISFEVQDVEATVAELRSRGVVPEEYDLPSFKTVEESRRLAGCRPRGSRTRAETWSESLRACAPRTRSKARCLFSKCPPASGPRSHSALRRPQSRP